MILLSAVGCNGAWDGSWDLRVDALVAEPCVTVVTENYQAADPIEVPAAGELPLDRLVAAHPYVSVEISTTDDRSAAVEAEDRVFRGGLSEDDACCALAVAREEVDHRAPEIVEVDGYRFVYEEKHTLVEVLDLERSEARDLREGWYEAVATTTFRWTETDVWPESGPPASAIPSTEWLEGLAAVSFPTGRECDGGADCSLEVVVRCAVSGSASLVARG